MIGIVKLLKFLAVLGLCTIMCAILWDCFVSDRLYHRRDSLPGGYFSPGHWFDDETPDIEIVVQGSADRYNSIKAGWTPGKLLGLWGVFFGSSVVVSGGFASRRSK